MCVFIESKISLFSSKYNRIIHLPHSLRLCLRIDLQSNGKDDSFYIGNDLPSTFYATMSKYNFTDFLRAKWTRTNRVNTIWGVRHLPLTKILALSNVRQRPLPPLVTNCLRTPPVKSCPKVKNALLRKHGSIWPKTCLPTARRCF